MVSSEPVSVDLSHINWDVKRHLIPYYPFTKCHLKNTEVTLC